MPLATLVVPLLAGRTPFPGCACRIGALDEAAGCCWSPQGGMAVLLVECTQLRVRSTAVLHLGSDDARRRHVTRMFARASASRMLQALKALLLC